MPDLKWVHRPNLLPGQMTWVPHHPNSEVRLVNQLLCPFLLSTWPCVWTLAIFSTGSFNVGLNLVKCASMMVIWRAAAQTRRALGARGLCSTAARNQSVDFSKAVEDFKTNGVAILPLRMDEEYISRSRFFYSILWDGIWNQALPQKNEASQRFMTLIWGKSLPHKGCQGFSLASKVLRFLHPKLGTLWCAKNTRNS